MAICGHQFHGGDEADWILSTSAGCLDGSTTAGKILKELFKKHCRSRTPRKRPKTAVDPPEMILPPKEETSSRVQRQSTPRKSSSKQRNDTLIVRKMTGGCGFENFDESQHLNGCPIKWLYNKKLLERSKVYKVGRVCSKKTVKKEEVKRDRNKNLRDKTPIEVKIHKINLIEKYTSNCEEFFTPYVTFPKPTGDLESHRKKLAAKLNWKLHDQSQEESCLETSSEISSRHNYLPPRPLLGLKPILSVLLSPPQDTNCCSLVALQNSTPRNTKTEASLSIQSLDPPLSPPNSKPRPKTTNTLRWGCKPSLHSKKLQIPNPITIKLEEKTKKSLQGSLSSFRTIHTNSPVKKLSDRTKQTKSLSSLFYELRGKTNFKNHNDRYFEDMIRDLTMDEGEFKISKFLNSCSANSDYVQVWQTNPEKRKKLMVTALTECSSNLVCGKVRFFEKKSSRGIKQEENER